MVSFKNSFFLPQMNIEKKQKKKKNWTDNGKQGKGIAVQPFNNNKDWASVSLEKFAIMESCLQKHL